MTESLSIVHLIPALTKGGAERVAVDLANASARLGHEVTILVGWKVDEKILRVRIDPSISVIYMCETPGGRILSYVAALKWLWKHRKWLAEQQILHLHLTLAALLGTIIYSIRRKERPVVIETYHSVGMPISQRLRSFHAWNCRRRDAVVLMANDAYWRDFKKKNQDIDIRFIPNGVDAPVGPATQEAVRVYLRRIGVPETAKRIIGTVGQFRSERRPQLMAQMFLDVLRDSPPDLHVLMCGSGPELDAVSAMVDAAGMSTRFTLPGVVNDPRLAMSAMSLYVTINVGEITGIAALEAMFCKVAVIAYQAESAVDSLSDSSFTANNKKQGAIDGQWIWSSPDPQAVVKKIKGFLESPKALEDVGSHQHNIVLSNYTVSGMIKRYIHLYQSTLGDKRNND